MINRRPTVFKYDGMWTVRYHRSEYVSVPSYLKFSDWGDALFAANALARGWV